MDSNNSGSLQSSSGGDEEYDSRTTEMISPFLHPFRSALANHSQPPPAPAPAPPLSHYQSHPPALFDTNLGSFSHPTANPDANPIYNLDSVWPRGLSSEPNYLGNLTGLSSSSSSSSAQSLLGVHGPGQGPLPSVDGDGSRAPARPDQATAVKASRKRSRASRRAPTTVLTTDTSNFRQMVQEFTGIPAPPFSAAAAAGSPFSRRLDLFGPGSTLRSGHLDPLGGSLYPFRPSAQKVNTSSLFSSSSQSLLNATMIETMPPTNDTITTSIAGSSSTSNSFQLPSDVLNLQNQVQTFQSLLQSPPKYPPANVPVSGSGSKPQGSSSSRVPSLDELGVSQERVDPGLGGFQGSGNFGGSFGGNNGGGDSQNGGYKLNCSASTSDFRPDKGLDNASSRNDSWALPSD
ncbi:hypothetical protein NMG60_11016809 [Bertholletia excelsa]